MLNRRSFLTASVAGVVLAGKGFAQQGGTELSISSRILEVNGKPAKVFGLLQPDGTQGLRLKAGAPFDVRLTNALGEPTIIHWHGQTPPWPQDGVPDMPLPLLAPGDMRPYSFAPQVGTHWMHAHTLQEQNLLAAPLIVRSAEDEKADMQEVVMLLHDFSFTPATELLRGLKHNKTAAGTAPEPASNGHSGMAHVMAGHAMSGMTMPGMAAGSGKMDAMKMDLNDINYDAYLANDRTLADPEIVKVERNGRVRLRIINGATATAFVIDLGALEGELIAVDGQAVKPVRGKNFPMVMGQRLDIVVSLPDTGAFPILARREGALERTGLILRSGDAQMRKIAEKSEKKTPAVTLELEQRLVAAAPLAARAANRRYDVMLMGDMATYEWAMTGTEALVAKAGERIEISVHNMSMMMHPMHLHGHHFQIVEINGRAVQGAVRDTVAVPPMARIVLALDANNPGIWPFHCHHLYHMASGMMSFLKYEGVG